MPQHTEGEFFIHNNKIEDEDLSFSAMNHFNKIASSSSDYDNNGNGLFIGVWLFLTAPFRFVLNNVIKALPRKSKRVSIFTIYVSLMLIFIIPAIIYLEETILFFNSDDYEVTSESSFRKLQRLNTDKLSQIILPPKENLLTGSTDGYMFDHRLPVAIALNKLKHHLLENEGVLDPNFQIPFSWADWVDLKRKLIIDPKYVAKWKQEEKNSDFHNLDITKMHCAEFKKLFNVEKDHIFRTCKDLSPEEELQFPDYPYKFRFSYKLEIDVEQLGRIVFGASYLYTSAPPPSRLHFIGAGLNKSSVILLTDRDADSFTPIVEKRSGDMIGMLNDMISDEAKLNKKSIDAVYKKGFRIDDIVSELSSVYNYDNKVQNIVNEDDLSFDQSHLLQMSADVEVMKSVNLTKEDFIWNHEDRMNSMQKSVKEINERYPNTSLATSLDHTLLKEIETEMDLYQGNDNKHPKYLLEANCRDTQSGNHFDWRFFNGLDHPEAYRKAIIHRIGRAWLRFCYQSGIQTFVAYGSMLGWVRNGLTLSWDEDIDVIVTVDSLYKLARNHNQSLIIDVSSEDKYAAGIGSYFLDIGPSFYTRRRGAGANVIDARLIDTSSGVYVDITGIAYTENYFEEHSIDDVIYRIIDKDYFKTRDTVESREEYEQKLAREAQALQDRQEMYHCRNNNVFSLSELTPMVPTFFEGVRTHVPHSFEKLLRRKYPGALDRNTEPGHIFKKYLRLWVKESDCPGGDREGEFCQDEDVMEEYYHTREYTARHLKLMEDIEHNELTISQETVPMIYDEFTIKYANLLNAKLV